MVFNSLSFVLFFVVVTAATWCPMPWTWRKILLTLFSYAFYAAWQPTTILLLWASTLLDYGITQAMSRSARPASRRFCLLLSLSANLGMLGFFKYGGFVATSLNSLSMSSGGPELLPVPHVGLPVGISFYTFMSIAFVIDVYRKRSEPPRSFLDFALFLTFYPHLVAGPIVNSRDFLPQCEQPRKPTAPLLAWGLTLIVSGLFAKGVVADTILAPIADQVFGATNVGTLDAWFGALAFSGQIFCDFAGYSTCAVGAAACLGFMLPRNFNSPYAAVGFSDFWQRWHISLSAWLRDYLYISLGGNRQGTARTLANLITTMLLGGLWHGASWMFVAWGALHGAFLCFERMLRASATCQTFARSAVGRPLAMAATFLAVSVAWVLFRAPDMSVVFRMLHAMTGNGRYGFLTVGRGDAVAVALTLGGMLLIQHQLRNSALVDVVDRVPRGMVVAALCTMLFLITAMTGDDRSFIYFQF